MRLHDVAARLGIPVEDILCHYCDLDSVANAWFRRPLRAMVAPKVHDFVTLAAPERIELCLLDWFDALAPHRRVTAQMLRGKIHLSHPHRRSRRGRIDRP